MQTINSEAPFLWRSSTVTSLCSYGDPLNHMEIQCCDPIDRIWDLDFRAVWKHCCDLTQSPEKHTLETMSRWINHHDLTVAMETDHNDLNGIRAFLFEVLYCNSTTMIRNISQKNSWSWKCQVFILLFFQSIQNIINLAGWSLHTIPEMWISDHLKLNKYSVVIAQF